MDAALLEMMRTGRNKKWANTMVNIEARKLINVANRLAFHHLKDGLTHMDFVQEIKYFIEQQLAAACRARTDKECIACIQKIRSEASSIEEQDRMLRTKAVKIYAKLELIRENNKIVGYVISAIKIGVSVLTAVGGTVMMATMPGIGVFAGAILVIDGINGVTKEVINLKKGEDKSEGFIADASMEVAKFMGCKPELGLFAYNTFSLAASVYSIAGLARRPQAWRLFRFIQKDYYRKVTSMSRPKLTMKIIGYGVKAKVTFDLINMDTDKN